MNRQNTMKLAAGALLLVCLRGLNAGAQETIQTTTISSSANAGGQANPSPLSSAVASASSTTTTLPLQLSLGGKTTQVDIPFAVSQKDALSIQSAAHVSLRVYMHGTKKQSAAAVRLLGLATQGQAAGAGTSLADFAVPGSSAAGGWLSVDVTHFVIQQLDSGSKSLSFRLQVENDPSAESLDTVSGTQFGSMVSSAPAAQPSLVIEHANVDATSGLDNKVMAGYQGWFRTPGDAAGNTGWAHWFNTATPTQAGEAIDAWPDMTEYTAAEQYAVPGFVNPDGSQAHLYSGQNARSVLRHFQWMENEGIDGIWLSQFVNHLPGGAEAADYPNVLNIMNNVRAAADATGRTWAFFYDTSGVDPTQIATIVEQQWQSMVDQGYTADANYLHQNGLPVVMIFGFFPNDSDHLLGDPTVGNPLITYFQTPGKYQAVVVGSGAQNWPTGSADYQAMLFRLAAYIPWNVGHYHVDATTGNTVATTTQWASDNATFTAHGVKYMPLVYAGTNLAGPPSATPLNARRQGNFLWEQFIAASQVGGINSVFVAMYDEMNEGTEILPVTNTPPTQSPAFYTYEGYPSDWYERLVSTGETMLKNGQPITSPIPIQP